MKRSYTVTPGLVSALSCRSRDGRGDPAWGASRALCDIVTRYDYVCRTSLPPLTVPELSLVCDALNGCWLSDSPGLALGGIPFEVADACRLNRRHEAHDVDDWEDLVGRLADLSAGEQMSLVDFVERFWLSEDATVEGLRAEYP